MTAVTQWFCALREEPYRKGRYQYQYAECQDSHFMAVWNGKDFIIDDGSEYQGDTVASYPGDKWRGLAKSQKGNE